MSRRQLLEEVNTRERNTAEKVSVFGVILIRISRIRTEYEEIPLSLCIQSKCGKIQTRITPNTDTFYAV